MLDETCLPHCTWSLFEPFPSSPTSTDRNETTKLIPLACLWRIYDEVSTNSRLEIRPPLINEYAHLSLTP